MKYTIMESRREFLKKTSVLTAMGLISDWACSPTQQDKFGDILPQRRLIRNGEKTTAFSLGGWHLGEAPTPKQAEQMIDRSIELGVRFFDTARGYQRGGSEEYYGQFLTPKYREHIFLMTKSHARNGKDAQKHLDESLKALKTDYLDLWQIHTLTLPPDVEGRINEGVLDVFLKAKEQGKTRYIGFTGHQNPETMLLMLKALKDRGLEMDTCQMPLNICDPSFESFELNVLPELLNREYGVIAMKTMSGGSMMGLRIDTTPEHIKTEDIPDMVGETGVSLAELHQYVYTLPISSLVSGCRTVTHIEQNVAVLQNLKSLSPTDKERLINLAKPYAGLIVENYKRVLG